MIMRQRTLLVSSRFQPPQLTDGSTLRQYNAFRSTDTSTRKEIHMLRHLTRLSALVVCALAVLLAAGCCQTSGGGHASDSAALPGNPQQEISALIDQYTQALVNKDVATLDKIWADDLSFINLHGELLSKQQRMDNIKTGA